MRTVTCLVVGLALTTAATAAWSHEGHEGSAGEAKASVAENTGAEQTLTGEVVDVFCYLTHGPDGLGKKHAGCAQHCIENGLPVALKVGDQLYLAAMAKHEPANQTLAKRAGTQVTVHGQVMEQDGQHLIAITQIEP